MDKISAFVHVVTYSNSDWSMAPMVAVSAPQANSPRLTRSVDDKAD